jgi:hypothetical protein
MLRWRFFGRQRRCFFSCLPRAGILPLLKTHSPHCVVREPLCCGCNRRPKEALYCLTGRVDTSQGLRPDDKILSSLAASAYDEFGQSLTTSPPVW